MSSNSRVPLFKKTNKSKKTGGVSIKPKGAAAISAAMNRLHSQQRSLEPSPAPAPASEGSLSASGAAAASSKPGRICPNMQCPDPGAPLQDGYCTACGREIETSNIVSELTFGETATGAAKVHGSYMAADQGVGRNIGPGGRRMGMVGEGREKTVRDAKELIHSYAQQLRLNESIVNEAVQVFKLASHENFVLGRGLDKLAPVCLYAACRKQDKCPVMLIDFADLVKVNVFDLGHVFKQLNDIYNFSSNGVKNIIPEDLIYRFADKLDFGDMTQDVAELAIRFCKRMGLDWMVMGRRPSGICGACILMAARCWGFRRTVREVVYVVKVTTATVEQRLDEFKVVESSNMTIDDFMNNEMAQSRHDPPSYYRSTAEWKEKVEKEREQTGRKRKRKVVEDFAPPEPGPSAADPPSAAAASKQAQDARDMPPPPMPDTSNLPDVAQYYHRTQFDDKTEGTLTLYEPFQVFGQVPATAPRITEKDVMADKDIMAGLDAEDANNDTAVQHLAEAFADEMNPPKAGARPRKRNEGPPVIDFDEEWEREEAELEHQIEEVIADPSSDAHRKALATAALIARVKAKWARDLQPKPRGVISMEEVVDEHEFDGDPEVEDCLLSDEQAKIKEIIWLNNNKDWMRQQQEKQFRAQMEALGPPKRKQRARQKKARIGEGQLGPARTAGEAAMAMMERHLPSKRILHESINVIFDSVRAPGSAAESRADSRADSRAATEVAEERSSAEQRAAQGREPAVDTREADEDDAAEEEEGMMDNYEDEGPVDEEYDGDGADWDEGFENDDLGADDGYY